MQCHKTKPRRIHHPPKPKGNNAGHSLFLFPLLNQLTSNCHRSVYHQNLLDSTHQPPYNDHTPSLSTLMLLFLFLFRFHFPFPSLLSSSLPPFSPPNTPFPHLPLPLPLLPNHQKPPINFPKPSNFHQFFFFFFFSISSPTPKSPRDDTVDIVVGEYNVVHALLLPFERVQGHKAVGMMRGKEDFFCCEESGGGGVCVSSVWYIIAGNG